MGETAPTPSSDATAIVKTWLSDFATALASNDVDAVAALFDADGWLRDLLTFTWDLRSLNRPENIKSYLENALANVPISHVKLDARPGLEPHFFEPAPGKVSIEAAFTFETPTALGRGYMLLGSGDDRAKWTASCVMMMVDDWKGHEERGNESGIYDGHNLSWEEVRQQRRTAVESDPQAIIVGAGQTGVQVAARFRQMNIRAIVVEQEARVGDVWRKRYPTLALHTPRSHHKLLYQPFPSNWPTFTPKEKLASWLEQYADTHDLVVWTSSQIEPTPRYNESTKRWDIVINKNGTRVTLHPLHLVMATSMLGDIILPSIPGLDSFKGESFHADLYKGGQPYRGKRVIVVGAANTSADICQDLVFHGATSVTMVQRSATCVVSDKVVAVRFAHAFPEGVPTEISDFKSAGIPLAVLRRIMKAQQPWALDADKEMHEGLRKAGFKLTNGPDESGQLIMVFERGGGYFIDVGCAPLIIEGKIKIKQGSEIARFTPNSVVFNDGSELEADAIIFATGWHPIREKWRRLFGDEVIDRTSEVWGTNEDGDVRSGYKPSGQPGLWFAMGDFGVSRFYSKQLALFIKAMEIGLTSF